ncbi:MAG TPA: response regulator [Bacteroidota bacterium]|jgi:DNA-binding NtrC family response regulator
MHKALVIDDDELDLELLTRILSKEGYSVISTADAPQGVLLYQHHRPAVVFLDLGLPSRSGIDVLREIRRFDRDARVILVTGYGSSEAASAAMRFGALEYIEKSTDIQRMIGKIRATIRKVAPPPTPRIAGHENN